MDCKVFFILLLFTIPAYASEYMVMQYNENVRIVLTKEPCKNAGFKAVAQRIDKEVMNACWSPEGKLIHIKWEGGDFSEFDISQFSQSK